MAVFNRNLTDTNEIFEAVSELCKDDSLGNKITIARMYSGANRYREISEKEESFAAKSRCKYLKDVIMIGDDSAIIVATNDIDGIEYYQPVTEYKVSSYIFSTLDRALIGLICLRTGNDDLYKGIAKMVGVYDE